MYTGIVEVNFAGRVVCLPGVDFSRVVDTTDGAKEKECFITQSFHNLETMPLNGRHGRQIRDNSHRRYL